MGRLCRYIRGFGLLTSDVDSLLSEILDENQSLPIPPQAFENIFGSLCFKTEGEWQIDTSSIDLRVIIRSISVVAIVANGDTAQVFV